MKGHGLGLRKRIVEDHHGVYVESEKGKGSTFIYKITLNNLKIPQIKYTMENINKRILLVEDDLNLVQY
jgi:hypothetical protein